MRRDNCELVRNVVATCLDKILIDRDEQAAVEYVKGIISDLLMNRVDMSLLVVTKVGFRLRIDIQQGSGYSTGSAHAQAPPVPPQLLVWFLVCACNTTSSFLS